MNDGPSPGHSLSTLSKLLGRDAFVFWTPASSPARLLAGLNQAVTKATVGDVYRWLRILGAYEEQHLHVASIVPLGVMRYASHPGQIVPENAQELLSAGNYEWVAQDGEPMKRMPLFVTPSLTMTERTTSIREKRPELVRWLAESPSQVYAPERDTNEACLFTGCESTQGNLKLAWIVPPVFSFEFDMYRLDEAENKGPAGYINDANTIIIRDDLLVDFHDNRFGVDVDNDCRIVTFRQRESTIALPSRLPDVLLSLETKCFLRDHFRWCLSSYFLGGDISKDIGFPEIHSAIGTLLSTR